MSQLKIWEVTFNDGGWHQSLPSCSVISEDRKSAIENAIEKKGQQYRSWNAWATEVKFDGYVIEVYDEKTYQREKSIKELGLDK